MVSHAELNTTFTFLSRLPQNVLPQNILHSRNAQIGLDHQLDDQHIFSFFLDSYHSHVS